MNVYKYNRNHVPELLCNLYAMYKNGECCDVTLKCSDGAVKAPGIILAAICPVLRQLGKYLTAEMDVNVLLPDFNVSVKSQPNGKGRDQSPESPVKFLDS